MHRTQSFSALFQSNQKRHNYSFQTLLLISVSKQEAKTCLALSQIICTLKYRNSLGLTSFNGITSTAFLMNELIEFFFPRLTWITFRTAKNLAFVRFPEIFRNLITSNYSYRLEHMNFFSIVISTNFNHILFYLNVCKDIENFWMGKWVRWHILPITGNLSLFTQSYSLRPYGWIPALCKIKWNLKGFLVPYIHYFKLRGSELYTRGATKNELKPSQT